VGVSSNSPYRIGQIPAPTLNPPPLAGEGAVGDPL
jgi:hypothetical protein